MNRLTLATFATSLMLCHSAQAKDPVCIELMTKVIKDGNAVCVSTKRLPECKTSCTAVSVLEKNVDFFCISKDGAAHHFEKRLGEGARDVDFSRKPASKTLRVTVPEYCVRG